MEDKCYSTIDGDGSWYVDVGFRFSELYFYLSVISASSADWCSYSVYGDFIFCVPLSMNT
eukprot:snap_masked-scaffold_32-processed-gene-3.18-mRNA-1 protein AED:1.00 eAED:1.00 QI:0/0/0/0/1/1/2/0/59